MRRGKKRTGAWKMKNENARGDTTMRLVMTLRRRRRPWSSVPNDRHRFFSATN